MCVGAEIIAWLVVLNCVNLALFPRVLFMRCAGLENCVEEPKAKPEDHRERQRRCHSHTSSLISWLMKSTRCSSFRFSPAWARYPWEGHQIFLQALSRSRLETVRDRHKLPFVLEGLVCPHGFEFVSVVLCRISSLFSELMTLSPGSSL